VTRDGKRAANRAAIRCTRFAWDLHALRIESSREPDHASACCEPDEPSDVVWFDAHARVLALEPLVQRALDRARFVDEAGGLEGGDSKRMTRGRG